ncbi:hypothetical protein [Azospirillum sp. B506]|uniref:hypothetical protein n=1 Tax=Azospirillum sp. B506 TaxID=137721 RepID=UPI00034A0E2B|nr:hypothetical protein [Azospirillum sp. B506]
MSFFPSPFLGSSTGRWLKRSCLDHALAVAVVALLLVGLSGEVRGALADLMALVEGAQAAVMTR